MGVSRPITMPLVDMGLSDDIQCRAEEIWVVADEITVVICSEVVLISM